MGIHDNVSPPPRTHVRGATFSADSPKPISAALIHASWEYSVQKVVTDEVNAMLREKLNGNKRAKVATLEHSSCAAIGRVMDLCV